MHESASSDRGTGKVSVTKNQPTATSKISQLPHQKSANCHIKNRPTATSIVKKVVEFEIKTAGTILADIKNNGDDQMSENTVYSYIKALREIFVIEDSNAWNPNLRSKTAIRTSDTRYFIDPSIATAALGLGPNDLINDLNTFGLIFETLAVRDLRVYAESLDGKVYHYRDKK